MPVLRADQFNITAKCLGQRVPGLWDQGEGFNVTAPDAESFPAGQKGKTSRGGRARVENGTITREYDPDRDDLHRYAASVGVPDGWEITFTPLDDNLNPSGKRPETFKGTAVDRGRPQVEQNTDGIGEVSIEISVSGMPG